MTNVAPIKIDILDGRLPLKGKGLEMTEFANVAELRRNQLEKLAAVLECLHILDSMKGLLDI